MPWVLPDETVEHDPLLRVPHGAAESGPTDAQRFVREQDALRFEAVEQAPEPCPSAPVGDPMAALGWLARTAREFGEPLRAGQVVLSGALGPMSPVVSGDEVIATITGLGTVDARFDG